MIARCTFLFLLTVLPAPAFAGGGWTSSLVSELDHNWGTVERGAQLSHQFTITNNTGKELRIKSVTPSCHCVSPMVADYNIPPGGSTILDARMNTGVFLGSKTVTITVTFDKPRRGDLQLRVSAVSTGGAIGVASTTEIDFGATPAGQKVEKKLVLDFSGASDRKIESIEFNKERVTAIYKEIDRKGDKVRYELALTLPQNLPIGQLEEKIRIKTNDTKNPETFVLAKARLEGQLTIVPDAFKIDQVAPGAKVTKNVIIKSAVPFRVIQVNNTLGMFAVRSGGEDKTVQMVSITFTAPVDAAAIPDHLEFLTDLPDGKPLTLAVAKEGAKK